MSLRARRLENEWKLLAQLAEHNPGVVEVVRRETLPDADVFHVILHRTSALALGDPPRLMELASHAVAFRYLSFYPSVPIEAFLVTPVFHPNVHPENGFVCLWDRFSSGDTIVEAIRKLQQVITWELWNDRAEHVMQPEALKCVGELSVPFPRALIYTKRDLDWPGANGRKAEPARRRLSR
jgi:ubiquitin-protein ligase